MHKAIGWIACFLAPFIYALFYTCHARHLDPRRHLYYAPPRASYGICIYLYFMRSQCVSLQCLYAEIIEFSALIDLAMTSSTPALERDAVAASLPGGGTISFYRYPTKAKCTRSLFAYKPCNSLGVHLTYLHWNIGCEASPAAVSFTLFTSHMVPQRKQSLTSIDIH